MKKPMLTPGESIKTCLFKLCDFKGRARRSEYWWYAAPVSIIGIIIIHLIFKDYPEALENNAVRTIVSVAYLFPLLSVTIRRIHDSGRSGWYILCGLLPALGALIMLLLMVADSEPKENKYGPSPKYVDDEDSQQNPGNNTNNINHATQTGV